MPVEPPAACSPAQIHLQPRRAGSGRQARIVSDERLTPGGCLATLDWTQRPIPRDWTSAPGCSYRIAWSRSANSTHTSRMSWEDAPRGISLERCWDTGSHTSVTASALSNPARCCSDTGSAGRHSIRRWAGDASVRGSVQSADIEHETDIYMIHHTTSQIKLRQLTA